MNNSQSYRAPERRIRRPYESVLQLVETYLVAECVDEMRNDFKQHTDQDLAKTIKPIDPFFVPLENEIKNAIKDQEDAAEKAKSKKDDETYSDALFKLARKKWDLEEFEEHKMQLKKAYIKACKLCQFEPFYARLIFDAIKDLFTYDFYSQPSLSEGDYKSNEDLDKEKGSYEAYRFHNLLFHTIHVFSQAVNVAVEKKSLGVELFVISALLHDYGKAEKIRDEILSFPNQNRNETAKQHQDFSGRYVYFILRNKVKKLIYTKLGPVWEAEHAEEVEDVFKKIQKAVTYHHAMPEDRQYDDAIAFVKNADNKAREKEKEFYFNEYEPWEESTRDKILESLIKEKEPR